jgi:ketosteroid isomerase-like protein
MSRFPMVRAHGAAAAALMLVWSCATQAGDKEDVAKLTELSNAWDRAIVAKQEAAVAGNMAEDFRIIDGYGNVDGKQKFVEDILDPRLTIDPYTVEDFEVRLYGDTALLSGRTFMTGKYEGKPFESNYRYIDVYVRRNGEWKIVSVQITKYPKPAQAPAAAR